MCEKRVSFSLNAANRPIRYSDSGAAADRFAHSIRCSWSFALLTRTGDAFVTRSDLKGCDVPELVIATAAGSVLLRVDLRDRDKLTIGRSDKCDVRLKGAAVSRHHGLLVNESGRWCLFDLSARSGVWMGDEHHRIVEMRDDVPVRIGDVYVWLFGVQKIEAAAPTSLAAGDKRRVMLRQEHVERLWHRDRVREVDVDTDDQAAAAPQRRITA